MPTPEIPTSPDPDPRSEPPAQGPVPAREDRPGTTAGWDSASAHERPTTAGAAGGATSKPAPGAASHHPSSADSPPDSDLDEGWEASRPNASGVLDVAPTDPPVPVSVWHASGPHDPPVSPMAIFAGLTRRLAWMLLAIWTDPDDTVIDATHDPAVAGAAAAGARRYRAVHMPPSPRLARNLAGRAGLILLCWPPGSAPPAGPADTANRREPEPAAVLIACSHMLRPGGHTMIVLTPPAGWIYRDYVRLIIPAARTAELGYLQHVVVITAQEDQPIRPGGPTAGLDMPPLGQMDILILVLARRRRGG
jgi:hypothetical protein